MNVFIYSFLPPGAPDKVSVISTAVLEKDPPKTRPTAIRIRIAKTTLKRKQPNICLLRTSSRIKQRKETTSCK